LFSIHHILSLHLPKKSCFRADLGEKKPITFAMRHWEKSKKDEKRAQERDMMMSHQDHRKKKLKPVEKAKYKGRLASDDEDDDY
jgi:hypothetical protein